jgi:hypothetical protein
MIIKHCPFCGGEGFVVKSTRWPRYGKNEGNQVMGYTVVCINVKCPISFADKKYWLTEKTAIKNWNRRHTES